ncbi:hypothetical protein [Maribacter sp. 2307ULW6-5]|uniref:hypothetical protein n=1 Tax=Maribacter sp. 2307ULW6-5 TaxID=3386275 RepID=UPI0039BC362C
MPETTRCCRFLARPLACALAFVLVAACAEDDVLDVRGTKLVMLTYAEGNAQRTEELVYDGNGLLVEVRDQQFPNGTKTLVSYTDGKPVVLQHYNGFTGSLAHKDSITYTATGAVERIYNLHPDPLGGFTLGSWQQHDYDANGQLQRKSTFQTTDTTAAKYHETYTWQDGNIRRMEQYNEDGVLKLAFDLEYDTRRNYQKNLPLFLSEALALNRNNVVKSRIEDRSYNIYWACNPCTTAYTYNLDGFPVEIRRTNQVISLTFEDETLGK